MTAPPPSAHELAALLRAVELAERGAGTVLPNPVVGCVILSAGGGIVGEGWHERPGGPHAEVVALAAAGGAAAGATAVVTLEPCDHVGRTGPCTQALLAAGISRVVVAVADPWPPAAGGAETLRAAGVDVALLTDWARPPATGEQASPSRALDTAVRDAVDAAEDGNRVWLTGVRFGRPFVTFKAGMTVDGRVAAADGTSRWITSAASRAQVHRLRARVDTMVVGVGTVLADDPQLTARGPDGRAAGVQPLRVVVDSTGRTPATARVFDDAAETMVATAAAFPGVDGRVDLEQLMRRLHRRGQRHVLLEGGPHLAAAMLDAGLVDEILLYIAPLILGAGRSVVDGGTVTTLAAAHRVRLRETFEIGGDIALRYQVLGPAGS